VTRQIAPRFGATEGKQQTMQARMKNPAMVLPDAMNGIRSLYKAMSKGGVPQQTLELVHLRASQINGCSACVYAGVASAKKAGETDERLFALPAWRESPFFTDAERAALTLTEAATRLSDRGDQVPDEIWDAAADHFSEQELAAIILMIATTNFFNRINATIKEPAGASWG
jgi:AhpD family alkylhydroperoxidase